ncbi:methyltransferase, TIGR04325 family [Chamaesiphon sp. VAR_48_metabat_403]|uniref:methyltransferase, TIGR04325 family n=1 Tax=Chamaesiphon sp. VAR_48_metabat_403 TaxID=2964700 RepID=UPI00286DF6CA|nr:methyltransferase, TIGR04325 family [Chamaesiphon sp. VAR_48_metabat_403]
MNEPQSQGLKQIFRDLLVSTPIVSDYYLHHWVFPKTSASCSHLFSSFGAATQAIPKRVEVGYNQPEFYSKSPAENIKNMEAVTSFTKPIDYPVMVWLKEAFNDSKTVFDLGGNTGYGYYTYQKFFAYPSGLKWKVCDLPEAVKAGEQMLSEIDSPGLSYTTEVADANGADIFITAGTLQYMEPSLIELLNKLDTKPRHLIVHHVPFYDGKEYFTLQNLLESYVPYKIQNKQQFLDSLKLLGYEVIDTWQIPRTCRIPFHPECFVDAYSGFYLRLAT